MQLERDSIFHDVVLLYLPNLFCQNVYYFFSFLAYSVLPAFHQVFKVFSILKSLELKHAVFSH